MVISGDESTSLRETGGSTPLTCLLSHRTWTFLVLNPAQPHPRAEQGTCGNGLLALDSELSRSRAEASRTVLEAQVLRKWQHLLPYQLLLSWS